MTDPRMHTIVLATQKGGSGKSTLAIGLALAAMQTGLSVRLIDTDPQGTLSNWRKRRAEIEPVVETIFSVQEVEPRLRVLENCGVALTIIDTAGGVSAVRTAAIRHADLCLIPVRPSIADVEATASTLSLVRAWKKPFAFVLNQTPSRGQRITNAADSLAEESSSLDLADVLAQPFVVMRNDHQDALRAGLAVGEYAPAGKSAEEIRSLWQWVHERLTAGAEIDEPLASDLISPPLVAALPSMQAESAALVF
jgi:chromosome partitioning protein